MRNGAGNQAMRSTATWPKPATVAAVAGEILPLHASCPQARMAPMAASAAGGDATTAAAFAVPCNDLLAGPGTSQAHLATDPGMPAAYAEVQQNYSPRIPHGKVTTWLRPIKIPCQGAIIY